RVTSPALSQSTQLRGLRTVQLFFYFIFLHTDSRLVLIWFIIINIDGAKQKAYNIGERISLCGGTLSCTVPGQVKTPGLTDARKGIEL
ncbi:MAG: hypothetical protein MJ188_11130, partial [Treponema sp.]|nr:hypothetical protein [Treponema sp.]